jgi:hypothetical protein
MKCASYVLVKWKYQNQQRRVMSRSNLVHSEVFNIWSNLCMNGKATQPPSKEPLSLLSPLPLKYANYNQEWMQYKYIWHKLDRECKYYPAMK